MPGTAKSSTRSFPFAALWVGTTGSVEAEFADRSLAMAGYSGTPLPKKLGIQENFRVAFVDLPAEVRAELRDALAACSMADSGQGTAGREPLDLAMLFVKTKTELKKQFA